MKIWQNLMLVILLAWQSPAMAREEFSFSPEGGAWNATDIVVATGGEKIDGNLRVLEVWKGSVKPDDPVSIPELAAFAPEAKRRVSIWVKGKRQEPPLHVTGSRMVLFLKKPTDASGKWQAADSYMEMRFSVAWIEQGKVYAFVQVDEGPSQLAPLRVWEGDYLELSEDQLKVRVSDITHTKTAMLEAAAITDLAERAKILRVFVDSKYSSARLMAFAELAKCGRPGMPVLRAMLDDNSLLPQHSRVVEALSKAGGMSSGPELTKLIESETEFWIETAPNLKPGWWNSTTMEEPQRLALQNRYSKLTSAIRSLERLKYGDCKTAVTNTRDTWR